jgi:hypothetical protein
MSGQRKVFVEVFRVTLHVPELAFHLYDIAELKFDRLKWLIA